MAALIVYASLYPFSDWRALPAAAPLEWLALPWRRYWWTGFDVVGQPARLSAARRAAVRRAACAAAWPGRVRCCSPCVAGAALSLAMEELQNFLPQRVRLGQGPRR